MSKSIKPIKALSVATLSLLAISVAALKLKPELAQRVKYSTTRSSQFNKRKLERADFPNLDVTKLSAKQIRIMEVAGQEYRKNPRSYDENVLKYSDENREPWCADFVSWANREAGNEFKNPVSGGWRIPGVFTLKEYYQEQSKWHPYEDGYIPKTGDTVIYSARKSPFGDHTNIVVSLDGKIATTVGGNENGQIGILKFKMDEAGIAGFGEL
jgi:CHAP domain